jgi:hypothetical protein
VVDFEYPADPDSSRQSGTFAPARVIDGWRN